MENQIREKENYNKIGSVWCPALNDSIIFNKIGFRHLIRKGKKRRSIREQKRRFALLGYAKGIVEDPIVEVAETDGKTIDIAKRHGQEIMSPAHFWALSEKRGDRIVTVVVRQIKGKGKHFFSIYDKKWESKKPSDDG